MDRYKLIIVILFLLVGISEATTTIAPDNANIQYIGRWQLMNISGTPSKVTISSGTRLRFKFTGTSLSLNFGMPAYTETPEIEYSIDGGAYTRTAISASTAIASGLSDTTHTANIWVAAVYHGDNKWNTFMGVQLQGIVLDDSKTVISWPSTAVGRMLTIGNSLAEGIQILGTTTTVTNTSGRLAFGNLIGESLNLENWNLAFGGTGFWGTYALSGVPQSEENYLYTMNGYAHTDPGFDIVLIVISDNDLQNIPPDRPYTGAPFITDYGTLLSAVLTNNPNAKVFCVGVVYAGVGGPMDNIDTMQAADANDCIYISPNDWIVEIAAGQHPTATGHQQIRDYISPYLDHYIYSGVLKNYTGASWEQRNLKRYTGAAWTADDFRWWDGTFFRLAQSQRPGYLTTIGGVNLTAIGGQRIVTY